MPNQNYNRGRRKEYAQVHKAREKGNLAFRSAGSHSPIDVVEIDFNAKVIRFIQCKPDSMSANQRMNIYLANKHLEGTYLVCFDVV
jgi:Holliday junction resolvase